MKLLHTLHTSPEVVFTYLTDMNLFASMHPVISRIEAKGKDHYLVFETLKIGPFPVSFSYPVAIHHDLSKFQVRMNATIFKLTKVEMSFALTTEKGITTIEEIIHVKSISPLNSLTLGVIKKQHLLLFDNIAMHLRQQA